MDELRDPWKHVGHSDCTDMLLRQVGKVGGRASRSWKHVGQSDCTDMLLRQVGKVGGRASDHQSASDSEDVDPRGLRVLIPENM